MRTRKSKFLFQFYLAILALTLFVACDKVDEHFSLKLWYDAPAADWNEALPIGNGRLGARGGFEIESMEWQDGALVKVLIKSALGGKCRIRSYSELTLENKDELKEAEGENINPFYQTPVIKEALISDNADLKGYSTPNSYIYDIDSEIGQTITLVRK